MSTYTYNPQNQPRSPYSGGQQVQSGATVQGGPSLAELQNANRGGATASGNYNQFGGNYVGQQQQGGQYANQLGTQQPANYAMPGTQPPNANTAGMSNYMFPGETGQIYNDRMQSQYDSLNQSPLRADQDVQRFGQTAGGGSNTSYGGLVGGGGASGGGTGAAGGSSGYGDQAERDLRAQREIAFQLFSDQRDFYNSDASREVQDSMVGQMRGTNSPYPALTTAQMGENADAGAAAHRRESQMARRYGSGSGQSGGGAEYSAIRQSGREQDANTTRGRRQIQTTNALLDDQRRERGRQEATNFLQTMADNNWRASKADADYRTRMQIVGDGGMGSGQGLGGLAALMGGSPRQGDSLGFDLGGYTNTPNPGGDNRDYGGGPIRQPAPLPQGAYPDPAQPYNPIPDWFTPPPNGGFPAPGTGPLR